MCVCVLCMYMYMCMSVCLSVGGWVLRVLCRELVVSCVWPCHLPGGKHGASLNGGFPSFASTVGGGMPDHHVLLQRVARQALPPARSSRCPKSTRSPRLSIQGWCCCSNPPPPLPLLSQRLQLELLPCDRELRGCRPYNRLVTQIKARVRL